ncbi:protein kinase [Lujinxingia vulgaris]|uniref:Protein kinase n=1 Tax=Lujinxingia vulgaris TaxID=2600176 RepID=A0A5C6XJP2_9DELT|nr:serine/threonine-protein kinase [Lujinxingia vulgaris]TXD37516.1 protein kinase [Lujinxingia vulgaris]
MSESFGTYMLGERIGVGGMAEVFLARSVGAEGVEKTLVIKKILPKLATDERFVEMFIAEAKIAMGLNHPNVVQIYDFGKVGQDYYLAMEHVDGVDLGHLLRAGQRAGRALSLGDALFVAIELARGLDYAHRRTDGFGRSLELVHRDISPQNVLISRDGAVKLVDFGIAKATSVREDRPGMVKGKYRYMSPEQARGEEVDLRSDLFSLGALMFELVCGRPLFRAESTDDLLSLVSGAVVPDIKALNPMIPEALEHLIYKALSGDREERPASAREMQRAMTRVLYGLSEIHDEMTLSQHLREVGPHLDREARAGESVSAGLEASASTVVGRTRVARGGASARAASLRTSMQVTPAMVQRRKEVVTIAGRLEGLQELQRALSPERWRHLVAEMTRIVDAIAFKNDGVLHSMDAAGFVVVLGLPISSENDGVRAARVARDLHEAVAGMNFSLDVPLLVSLGIATSEVLIEHPGSGLKQGYRWEFLERGDADARSLASAALARETLIGPQVFQRVRRAFYCEAIQPVAGNDEARSAGSAPAYRLVGPKSARERIKELRRSVTSFYGRDVERRVVRQAYRRVAMDRLAGALVLVGPAGVGKSALLEEFLSGFDSGQARVLRAVASPYERDQPLGSAAAFFAEALELGSRDDLRQLAARLEKVIETIFVGEDEEERELLFDSLATVFGVPVAERAFARLDRDERQRRIYLSLSKLVSGFAASGPVIIAIDDAHYIDPVMLEFTARYFETDREAPVFMVCTARDLGPHTESDAWQRLVSSSRVEVESVGELSGRESRRLVRDLLRLDVGEDQALVEEVLHRTGGNPLYIREVVEAIRDRVGFGLSTDSVELSDEAVWLPASVEGIIGAKLERLPSEARAVLVRVALFGVPFERERAERLLEQPCGEAIALLVESGILEEVGAQRSLRYRFCNELTREVAARGLLAEHAAELHGRIAADLMAQEGEGALRKSALVARHLEASGDGEGARSYYVRAAREASRLVGAQVCVRHCDRVLEMGGAPTDELIEVLLLKEEACQEIGDDAGARSALGALEDLISSGEADARAAEVWLRLARYQFQRASFREARDYLSRAEEAAERLADCISLAQVARQRAVIDLTEGHRDGALEVVDAGLLLLDEASIHGVDPRRAGEVAVELYTVRGVVLRQTGRHREALIAYDRALSRARELELPRHQRQILTNSGLALAYVGRFTQAMARYESALAMCRQLGHRRDEALLLVNIGHVNFLLGQTRQAISEIQRGLHLARRTGYTTTEADGQISLGLCYLELGQNDQAEHALHEGLRLADSIPHAYLAVCATLALAQVKLQAESPGHARVALLQAEDAMERAEQADMRWGRAFALSLMARAHACSERFDQALTLSRQALAMLDEVEIYGEDEVNFAHAHILQLIGDDALDAERTRSLRRARAIVQERASSIDDERLRRDYLARPLNARITAASGDEPAEVAD